MIFFTKGVVETVKKLNWSPDIIHLHGWFTSLFPLYLKTYYKDEPIFKDCKIVTSVYAKDFEGVFSKDFQKKVAFDEIPNEEIKLLKNATFENLTQLSLNYSDGYVIADPDTPEEIVKSSAAEKISGISFEEAQQKDAFINFYSQKII
jgi:starch synthase